MLTFVVIWVLCTVAFFAVKKPTTFPDGLRDVAAGALSPCPSFSSRR